VYFFFSHEYTDTPSDSKDIVISVNSFQSKIIRVKVGMMIIYVKEKKQPWENRNVLVWSIYSINVVDGWSQTVFLSPLF
jgi:hypothetical protein